MPAVGLYPEHDARTNFNDPNTVQPQGYLCSGADVINLGAGFHGLSYSWMRFNLSSIPVSATILSAQLYGNAFYVQSDYTDFIPATVLDAADTTWTEASITWNNQPTPGSVLANYNFDGTQGSQTFNISLATAPVQSALAAGKISLVMYCDDEPQSGVNSPCVAMQDYDYTSPTPADRYPYLLIVYALAGGANTSAIPKGSIALTGRAPGASTTNKHKSALPAGNLALSLKAISATKTEYLMMNRRGEARARRADYRPNPFPALGASERLEIGRSSLATNTTGSRRSAKSRGNKR